MNILGIDDSITTCGCCGKSGLKFTILVERTGEVFNYGRVCATKHTGLGYTQIKQNITCAREAIKTAAKLEYTNSTEYLMHCNKLRELNNSGVKSGREFYAAQMVDLARADAKKIEIAAKYKIAAHSF
jgi:hypothetical protein